MTPAETAVRDAFAAQAEACAERGSPFTGLLCEALGHSLDRSTEVGRRVLDWPGRPDARGDSVPLRLAAGLHALVRRGRVPRLAALYPPNSPPEAEALRAALAEAVADAEADLLPWLDLPPQTNEPMRSGPLMAGLLAVAAETGGLPLALHEIGASAGLVLVLDRYDHRLGGAAAGTPGAAVTIAPAWEGGPPPQEEPVRVANRRGCDLDPLDVTDPEDRERLLAYVWPDQADRLARTKAAIGVAAPDPPRLDRAEAAAWAEAALDPGAAEPGNGARAHARGGPPVRPGRDHGPDRRARGAGRGGRDKRSALRLAALRGRPGVRRARQPAADPMAGRKRARASPGRHPRREAALAGVTGEGARAGVKAEAEEASTSRRPSSPSCRFISRPVKEAANPARGSGGKADSRASAALAPAGKRAARGRAAPRSHTGKKNGQAMRGLRRKSVMSPSLAPPPWRARPPS